MKLIQNDKMLIMHPMLSCNQYLQWGCLGDKNTPNIFIMIFSKVMDISLLVKIYLLIDM